jgi:branched-chain amino acid transport system substrate-binding protein
MLERVLTFATMVMSSVVFLAATQTAVAQKKYDVGATDSEIKIGNVMPYSGPASAYAVIGKVEAAYFKMINEQGGINGRRIAFISYDDGYSPPKTLEQTRRLVEGDEVLMLFNIVGTPGNAAIQQYVNERKVPHLFISSGASRWNDPAHFPWSMAWWPSFENEARVYAKYIEQTYPDKTIGILYQHDDLGKGYLTGLHDFFGAGAAKKIVAEESYELTDPTVDSQIIHVMSAHPDIFINLTTPKFAALAIRKVAGLDWHPIQFLSNVSVSYKKVIVPAGVDNAKGIISATYMKDPDDPQWADDQGMNEFKVFVAKYYPEADRYDATAIFGYGAAKALARILEQCGDDLTRDNIMKQMTHLDMAIDIYLPGIKVKTSPTDYAAIDQLQLVKFTGQRFELFGSVIGSR